MKSFFHLKSLLLVMSDMLLELLLNVEKPLWSFLQKWTVRLQAISSFSCAVTNHKFSSNWQHSLTSFSSILWWVFCQHWNFMSPGWVSVWAVGIFLQAIPIFAQLAITHIYTNMTHKYILLNQNYTYPQLHFPFLQKSLTTLTPPGTGRSVVGKLERKR